MYLNVVFTQWLIEKLKPKVYVEIGVGPEGSHLKGIYQPFFAAGGEKMIAVDIDPSCPDPDAAANSKYHRFNEPSSKVAPTLRDWGVEIDLMLVDGDHSFQGAYQDFLNFGPLLREHTGVMLMHDTFPPDPNTATPERGSRKVWCGDVWKAAQKIRQEHSQEYEFSTLPVLHGVSIVRRVPVQKQVHWA